LSTRLLVVAGLLGSLACAHQGITVQSPETAVGIEPSWALAATDLGTQTLFRVRYKGPEGDGGLRLILRLDTNDRFQLVASNVLGKAVWSMETYDQQVLLVDHSEKTYCETGMDLVLPEVALDPLPVKALPGVLLGYLPVAIGADSVTGDGKIDFIDADLRRWTGSFEAGKPSSWMLWERDQPVLWWSRQDKGGILSHRQGVQFRWKSVVSESLEGGFERLAVPESYKRAACHESHV
jgi:hypothetical protein